VPQAPGNALRQSRPADKKVPCGGSYSHPATVSDSRLMYRFFEPVIRPLLDAVGPRVVVEVGSDKGLQTALLLDWCQSHEAILHCVDPFPKYDVDEWLDHWPGTLRFHRDLSLNALVDIGHADFVCIDGDHNWYTVFHELEILGRSARTAGQQFPVTVLHDVGWPYGRRDLYYNPETIPDAFRHPHRKAGLVRGQRALADRGFNDHLENAIHEGTPRNGVLTAVEDFVATYDGNLTMNVLPGLHGLGVILNSQMAERISDTFSKMVHQSGGRLLEAVEQDRIDQLETLWKTQSALHRERERVKRLRQEASNADAKVADLKKQLNAKVADLTKQLTDSRAERDSAQARAGRAEQWYRESVVLHEQETDKLRELIEGSQAQLRTERSVREESERDYARLRGRRSVRFALSLASVARPFFRLRRGEFRRGKAQGEKDDRGSSPEEGSQSGESPTTLAKIGQTAVTRDPIYSTAGGIGRFYTVLESLMDDGVPHAFIEAWNDSESSTRPPTTLTERPLVSIIMPTYNRADIIVDALASVLEQTYEDWELLVCDDASDDGTETVIQDIGDRRISYQKLPKGGAAMARNAGLAKARGELIAYLDSDNLWHPRFLETFVSALVTNQGQYSAYCKYIDVVITRRGLQLRKFDSRDFAFDTLAARNFIDLNSFVHRRFLFDHLGGFDERLVRQQDWDLVLRYSYLRDPIYIDSFLMMYRRNDSWNQITTANKQDKSSPILIRAAVDAAYRDGLASTLEGDIPSMTVLSWDVCRNHFSKAYNISEAMAGRTKVQLLGFRFFDEPIFPPYAKAEPQFETLYLPGGEFPDWGRHLARAVANISGDVIYAVKPRLPSLGVALLANYHFGKQIVLEINDLESVVTSPRSGDRPSAIRLSEVDPTNPELRNPYGALWTSIMEGLVLDIPRRVTHNSHLDRHFGGGAYYVRNPKDERLFDPNQYDRVAIREGMGLHPEDRVLLFGGMVRRHKGVFELAELVREPGSPYHLLVVGARNTPDQDALKSMAGERVQIIDPVDRNDMAAINLASDAVVLWLDPSVAASQYQMPFKLTDALAMKVPIVANDIGDLGDLGRSGFLHLVPFGQMDELKVALDDLLTNKKSTSAMVEAGRRLYLRQFSYNAVQSNLQIILSEAASDSGVLPVAKEFAHFFSDVVEGFEQQAIGIPPNGALWVQRTLDAPSG
jgi:glycosyltransferase involved in cell wall biosynthesis